MGKKIVRYCCIAMLCLGVFCPVAAQQVEAPHSRKYYDSLFMAYTGDVKSVPFYKRLSLSTNIIDWGLATPNASLEIDLSGKKRNRYSILFSGKWNPEISNHTKTPRWSYDLTGVRGELRRYWRTGNQEGVKLPVIERDTTLWGPFSKLSYLRRRYLSSRYVKHSRYWRAYYLGLYGAYNKFSVFIDGEGKQGKAASVGLSGGWSVPLYKHFDGSGWDVDLGASVGVMMTAYNKYKYRKDWDGYEYLGHKMRHIVPYPMVSDVHISLVYRLRTIDNKALYGATRFMLREERRAERENMRLNKIAERNEKADSTMRYTDINVLIDKSKSQLALYTDTTSYYYEVLKAAIEYTEYDIEDLRTNNEWQFKREVLMRNLEYYMNLANEMAPEAQRTDRAEREAQRKKNEKLRLKEEQKQTKIAKKQAKKERKKKKGKKE